MFTLWGGFEEDRQVLQSKIDEAYVSKGHFEILVQAPWAVPVMLLPCRDKQIIFQFDMRTSFWHRDHTKNWVIRDYHYDSWVAIGCFHYETMNFSLASLILFDLVWWLWRQRLLPSWRRVCLSELADHRRFDFHRFRKVACCRCSMVFFWGM